MKLYRKDTQIHLADSEEEQSSKAEPFTVTWVSVIYSFVFFQLTVSAMKQSFDQCLHHPIIPWGGGASALFSYINVLDSFGDYATKYFCLNNQADRHTSQKFLSGQ